MFHSTNHQAVIMAASAYCHRPFPLHFEPDSFLPDRLVFFNPALSKLHCQECRQQTDIFKS